MTGHSLLGTSFHWRHRDTGMPFPFAFPLMLIAQDVGESLGMNTCFGSNIPDWISASHLTCAPVSPSAPHVIAVSDKHISTHCNHSETVVGLTSLRSIFYTYVLVDMISIEIPCSPSCLLTDPAYTILCPWFIPHAAARVSFLKYKSNEEPADTL